MPKERMTTMLFVSDNTVLSVQEVLNHTSKFWWIYLLCISRIPSATSLIGVGEFKALTKK